MIEASGAFDVRLMRTLLLLVTECSVSRTAEILDQSQPTVSLALKRLRELLGDPILVRSGGTLVPTERALELRVTVRQLLAEVDATLSPMPSFDPFRTERCFRIFSANCLGTVLLPRIFEAIRQQAPHARVTVVPMPSYDDLLVRLADGGADIVIGNWPNPPDHLRIAPLISTPIKCVVADTHPLARLQGKLTLERYLALDHLSPTSDQVGSLSPVDGRLLALGLKRRIAAAVPEYALVPHVLAGSDLVFTTGAPFAEHINRLIPSRVIDAPEEFGSMSFYLLWHECKHRSPSHTWLRQLLKELVLNLPAEQIDLYEPSLVAAE